MKYQTKRPNQFDGTVPKSGAAVIGNNTFLSPLSRHGKPVTYLQAF
jgi:hypothetical protein